MSQQRLAYAYYRPQTQLQIMAHRLVLARPSDPLYCYGALLIIADTKIRMIDAELEYKIFMHSIYDDRRERILNRQSIRELR